MNNNLLEKTEECRQLLVSMDTVLGLRCVQLYLRIYGLISEWLHACLQNKLRMIGNALLRPFGVRRPVHQEQTYCFAENLSAWMMRAHENLNDFEQTLNGNPLLREESSYSPDLGPTQSEHGASLLQTTFLREIDVAETTPLSWLQARLSEVSIWVSVIVPVYNVLPYLDRCIESIVRQTVQPIEIILVDDGSTDKSGARCDEWTAKDGRIRVLHQKNGGLSAARNTGIGAAVGKYFMFTDSDDWIEPDMMEKLLFAAETCNAQIAECNYEHIFPDHIEKEKLSGGDWLIADRHRAASEEVHWGRFKGVAWNKLYRRELFTEDIRYPAGKCYEDEFLTHRLFYKAERLVSIEDILYHYDRTRKDSITGQAFYVHGADRIEAMRAHTCFLREHREERLYLILLNRYAENAAEFLRQCQKKKLYEKPAEAVRAWLLEDREEFEANGIRCEV